MIKTISLTTLALLAFAGNSILCRLALKEEVIDAFSFTSIRLFSGVVFLLLLVILRNKGKFEFNNSNWFSAFFLFIYAIAFSYSYITLDTGTGALILFGSVQVTLIASNFLKGKKLFAIEWLGLLIAFFGLCVLLLPETSAPPIIGFILMTISGVAWGCYTLAGKHSKNPIMDTTSNFLKTLPFIVLMSILLFDDVQMSSEGIFLAIISGAITSGLGYAIWYSVLEDLTITQAAIVQLTVPIIAAFGGVLFSNEMITIKLIVSSFLVLGGIFIVTIAKQYILKEQK